MSILDQLPPYIRASLEAAASAEYYARDRELADGRSDRTRAARQQANALRAAADILAGAWLRLEIDRVGREVAPSVLPE